MCITDVHGQNLNGFMGRNYDLERMKDMNKRLNYIDNLRSISVFLLVLYHIAIAYNSWGEANYIFFERVNSIASIVVFISPWFMPLMFLLAGVSASFSMKKRGCSAFVKERLKTFGNSFDNWNYIY